MIDHVAWAAPARAKTPAADHVRADGRMKPPQVERSTRSWHAQQEVFVR
jgi:hypothetical protein